METTNIPVATATNKVTEHANASVTLKRVRAVNIDGKPFVEFTFNGLPKIYNERDGVKYEATVLRSKAQVVVDFEDIVSKIDSVETIAAQIKAYVLADKKPVDIEVIPYEAGTTVTVRPWNQFLLEQGMKVGDPYEAKNGGYDINGHFAVQWTKEDYLAQAEQRMKIDAAARAANFAL